VIPAAEALTLPSAKLTSEEVEAANKLEAEMEEYIRKFMARRGCDFKTSETRTSSLRSINDSRRLAIYRNGKFSSNDTSSTPQSNNL